MAENSSFKDFGFDSGDDNVSSSGKFDRLKFKENETIRASFVWFPQDIPTKEDGSIALPLKSDGTPDLEKKSPRFIGAQRHFITGVGYVLAKGAEMAKLAGGPAKMTVATIVVVWPTDRKGEFSKERFAAGEFDVKPYVFSTQMYDTLKTANAEWPLLQYDVKFACTDTQYQKVTLTPCRESLYLKLGNSTSATAIKMRKEIAERVAEIAKNLPDLIAKDMSVDKVREKLGGSPAASVTPENAAAVDDMLDDLLAE